MEKEEKRSGKSFWSPERMAFAAVLILGILVGGMITHFVLEPLWGNSVRDELSLKTDEANSLRQNYCKCMAEKGLTCPG